MREKLFCFLFLGLQMGAGIMLLIQLFKGLFDVTDENFLDYIAFGLVFLSLLLTLSIVLHNYYSIANEQIELALME